jgi:hypothetical protein
MDFWFDGSIDQRPADWPISPFIQKSIHPGGGVLLLAGGCGLFCREIYDYEN